MRSLRLVLGPASQAAALALGVGQLLLAGLQGGGEPVDAGCGPGEVGAQPAQLVGLSIADLFGVLELGLGGGLGGGNALQRALLDQLRAARCWPQYAGCRSCRDGR